MGQSRQRCRPMKTPQQQAVQGQILLRLTACGLAVTGHGARGTGAGKAKRCWDGTRSGGPDRRAARTHQCPSWVHGRWLPT